MDKKEQLNNLKKYLEEEAENEINYWIKENNKGNFYISNYSNLLTQIYSLTVGYIQESNISFTTISKLINKIMEKYINIYKEKITKGEKQ